MVRTFLRLCFSASRGRDSSCKPVAFKFDGFVNKGLSVYIQGTEELLHSCVFNVCAGVYVIHLLNLQFFQILDHLVGVPVNRLSCFFNFKTEDGSNEPTANLVRTDGVYCTLTVS